MTAARAGVPPTHSQTLDRGVRVLELIHEAERPLRSAELARALEVHRSIAYRVLRTLEAHRLVSRAPGGGWQLGVGLAVLARGVQPSLDAAATPELVALANDVGLTAFLAVADGAECVTLLSVEPRESQVHVATRPGRRHPLDRGGPGIALLAGGPVLPGERAEVAAARKAGHAHTRGEVVVGLSSVAAPVLSARDGVVASLAVLFLDESADVEALARRVRRAAAVVASRLP